METFYLAHLPGVLGSPSRSSLHKSLLERSWHPSLLQIRRSLSPREARELQLVAALCSRLLSTGHIVLPVTLIFLSNGGISTLRFALVLALLFRFLNSGSSSPEARSRPASDRLGDDKVPDDRPKGSVVAPAGLVVRVSQPKIAPGCDLHVYDTRGNVNRGERQKG